MWLHPDGKKRLTTENVQHADGSVEPEKDAVTKFAAMSRPCGPGESIDFFITHSWHDCGESKWEILARLVEDFQKRQNRYPTFGSTSSATMTRSPTVCVASPGIS